MAASRGPQGDWQATLAATYHTGWPTTPVRLVGTVPGSQTVSVGPRNASRLGAYASVDARVSRDFALPRGTLNVFAEVSNAFDRQNPCCTDFSYEIEDDGAAILEHEYRNWLPAHSERRRALEVLSGRQGSPAGSAPSRRRGSRNHPRQRRHPSFASSAL